MYLTLLAIVILGFDDWLERSGLIEIIVRIFHEYTHTGSSFICRLHSNKHILSFCFSYQKRKPVVASKILRGARPERVPN